MASFSRTKDMTKGSPMKLILSFCGPLLLGFLFQKFYNVADAAIVGRFLGADSLAAVGCTGPITSLLIGFCNGLCTGFGIPVAQAFGAGDLGKLRRCVQNAFRLCIIIALLLSLLGFLCPFFLQWMSTPEAIYDEALAYVRIIIFSISATILYNGSSAILRALGDSKTPVVFLTLSSLLNIALDLVLIRCAHWGVVGAALATGFSQLLSGIGCFVVLIKNFPIIKAHPDEKKADAKIMRLLLGMGLPMAFQWCLTSIGNLVLQYYVNGLGTAAVAALTANGKICIIFNAAVDALASSIATFAGQNLGAGRLDRIRNGMRGTCLIGAAYSLFASCALIFLGRSMVVTFLGITDEAVLDYVSLSLRQFGFAYLLLMGVNLFRLCIQGMGFTKVAMFAGLMEMLMRILVAIFLIPRYGYTVVGLAAPLAWVGALAFLIPYYIHAIRRIKKKLALE